MLWRDVCDGPHGTGRIAAIVLDGALFAFGSYVTLRYAFPLIAERFAPASSWRLITKLERSSTRGYVSLPTSWGEFFLLLTVAGLAAEGVAAEVVRHLDRPACHFPGRAVDHYRQDPGSTCAWAGGCCRWSPSGSSESPRERFIPWVLSSRSPECSRQSGSSRRSGPMPPTLARLGEASTHARRDPGHPRILGPGHDPVPPTTIVLGAASMPFVSYLLQPRGVPGR